MKIYLHEITDQEMELDFTQDESWVSQAVFKVDERSEEPQSPKKPTPRPIQVQLSLKNVDDVIIVSGKIHTFIELICSRCAVSFNHSCQPDFSALFCKDPVMAGVAHLHRQGTHPHEKGRPMGQNQGFARHAHDSDHDLASSEGKDLDITYLSNDYIDLGEVLTEQLQFQVPFQPLCKADCQGICSNCGTDQNQSRCACSKFMNTGPFSVLNTIKI